MGGEEGCFPRGSHSAGHIWREAGGVESQRDLWARKAGGEGQVGL